jgi:hypothetical protein
MRYYCTFFDSGYLAKALALYESMERWCGDFRLYALCLDDVAFEHLTKRGFRSLVPISIRHLEEVDPELGQAKLNRSRSEFYFTCSPCFPLHVLKTFPEVDLLVSIDADTYFFESPEPIFEEMALSSIGLTEHRYSPGMERYRKYGAFNVGWIMFRRDEEGLGCLEWWRDRCLEWCHDRLDGDRFADQKYLEKLPGLFNSVKIIPDIGLNLGHWNFAQYRLTCRDGRVFVDGQPLIFFHFASVREVRAGMFRCGIWVSGSPLAGVLRRNIFRPYIDTVRRLAPPASPCPKRLRAPEKNHHRMANVLRSARKAALGILTVDYVLIVNDRAV